MKVSSFLIRVLNDIVTAKANGSYLTPYWIASRVFPDDHPGWLRSCKCGAYGSTRGSGLVMFMGGYLGKLRKAGLITEWYDIHQNRNIALTVKGERVYKENLKLLEDQSNAS